MRTLKQIEMGLPCNPVCTSRDLSVHSFVRCWRFLMMMHGAVLLLATLIQFWLGVGMRWTHCQHTHTHTHSSHAYPNTYYVYYVYMTGQVAAEARAIASCGARSLAPVLTETWPGWALMCGSPCRATSSHEQTKGNHVESCSGSIAENLLHRSRLARLLMACAAAKIKASS